jgi:cytochrome P450
VSQAFSPRRIEELAPCIVQIVDELLEVAVANGKMNVDTEFAYPLPMRVMGEILGLPLKDQERFRQWSARLVDQLSGIRHADNTEILHYFSDLLNERKRAPQDDLMSALVAAEENGPHVTHETLTSLCVELMLAGHITTSRLLTSAIRRSCEHPEVYQSLRDDPSLIPGAIEETLRYDLPLDQWRIARHDTVLSGQEIKAGQYVVTWTGAANFDETYFPHAEQFDIRRSPNPHLAFGHGVHACPGYALARLEGRITLERIIAHFSEIHLDTEHPVRVMDLIWPKPMRFLNILLTAGDAPTS